ncbi:MAG: hypothetical protein IKH01_11640 [Prevotella sp.]|nr:hypothetical protein [Prevotella sp.]
MEASDFVYFDGTYIEERKLVNMAIQAGSYLIAEHYLCSLLYHAVMHKKDYLADEVNKIRKFYTLPPFPSLYAAPDKSQVLPFSKQKKKDYNDLARERFQALDEEKKIEIVRNSLILLVLKDENLFDEKKKWIGIYLVIRDRLCKMSCIDFKSFANKCTPAEWEDGIRIGETTMSNIGRYISYEDRDEAYYDMKNNPFEDLCDKFWDILVHEILNTD